MVREILISGRLFLRETTVGLEKIIYLWGIYEIHHGWERGEFYRIVCSEQHPQPNHVVR